MDREQSARLVLVATLERIRRQAGAAAKRRDFARVARLAAQYRRLETALLEG